MARYRVNRPPGPIVVVGGVRYFPGDEFDAEPKAVTHYVERGAVIEIPQPGASPSATGIGSAVPPSAVEPVSPSEVETPEWSGPDVADTIDIEPTVIDPDALKE